MTLRKEFCQVISEFPYRAGRYGMEKEDYFQTLVTLCLEVDHEKAARKSFRAQAHRTIETELTERKREMQRLYNPWKNLYLDKCYGDSKTPLGEWMDFSREE